MLTLWTTQSAPGTEECSTSRALEVEHFPGSGADSAEAFGLQPEAGAAEAFDEDVTDGGCGGEDSGAWREFVAMQGQRQSALGEHHRGGLVPGVAFCDHP